MIDQTYHDERVNTVLKGFECALADPERDAEVGRRYPTDSYPCVVFRLPSGEEVCRTEGYEAPEEFIVTLQGVSRKVKAFSLVRELEPKLLAGSVPEDGLSNVNMADGAVRQDVYRLVIGFHTLEFPELDERWVNLIQAKDPQAGVSWAIISGIRDVAAGLDSEGERELGGAVDRVGDHPLLCDAIYYKAIAQLRQGRWTEARDTLEDLLNGYPKYEGADEVEMALDALDALL